MLEWLQWLRAIEHTPVASGTIHLQSSSSPPLLAASPSAAALLAAATSAAAALPEVGRKQACLSLEGPPPAGALQPAALPRTLQLAAWQLQSQRNAAVAGAQAAGPTACVCDEPHAEQGSLSAIGVGLGAP